MQIPFIQRPDGLFQLFTGEQFLLPLRVGKTVKGEVLEVLPGNLVSIKIKNEVIQAKTDLPLQKGMNLLFQVESIENEIKLKYLGAQAEPEGAIKNAVLSALNQLRAPRLNAEELKVFLALINTPPSSLKEKQTRLFDLKKFFYEITDLASDDLQEMLRGSGTLFETKLRSLTLRLASEGKTSPLLHQEIEQLIDSDLKGSLLKLKSGLSDPDLIEALQKGHTNIDPLKATVDKLINRIEHEQLLSKLDASFQPFIPLVWRELKEGTLIFKESYKDASGKKDYSVTINLNLEKIGRLSVHLMMQGESLHVRFVTESRLFQGLLQSNTHFLEERLDTCGLHCAGIAVRHEEKLDFNAASLSSPEGLDLVI